MDIYIHIYAYITKWYRSRERGNKDRKWKETEKKENFYGSLNDEQPNDVYTWLMRCERINKDLGHFSSRWETRRKYNCVASRELCRRTPRGAVLRRPAGILVGRVFHITSKCSTALANLSTQDSHKGQTANTELQVILVFEREIQISNKSHSQKYCDVVGSGKHSLNFRRNILLPFSGLKIR
jgi:hypothetical protein